MPTPALEWVTQNFTRDESYTPEYTHSFIMTGQQIANLRPGRMTSAAMKGHTITSVGSSTYLWPDHYRVTITTVDAPQGYEQQIFVTAQFLPWYKNVLSGTAAIAQMRDSQPFTAETDGREVVTFITADQSALLAAPNPELPRFRGEPIGHYGVVYSATGGFLGWTTPRIPPTQVITDRRIDKWRPGWNRVTTIIARRSLIGG